MKKHITSADLRRATPRGWQIRENRGIFDWWISVNTIAPGKPPEIYRGFTRAAARRAALAGLARIAREALREKP